MFKYLFKYNNARIKNQIKDIKNNKENFLNNLKQVNYLEIYEKSLSFILSKTDNFFGDRLLSFKAFDKHFILAIIYSFLFFLFSYVITGANEISHLEIMSKEDNLFMRILFILLILLIMLIPLLYFIYAKNSHKIADWVSSILKVNNKIAYWVLLTLEVLVGALVGLGALVGGRVLVGEIIAGVGVIIGVIILRAVIEVGVGIGIVGFVVVAIVVSIVVELFNNNIKIALLVVFILYSLFFPLVNAFFDFISTACSRYLAKKLLIDIKKRNHLAFMPIVYFIADIIFAICTFFLLASFLYLSFDVANYIAISLGAKEDILISEEIYQSLRSNFFGEYLWITIMLLSTFMPTIIHLVISSLSFISFISLENKNKHIISLIESNLIREGAEEYINLKTRKKILSIGLLMIISYIFLYFFDLPSLSYIKSILN